MRHEIKLHNLISIYFGGVASIFQLYFQGIPRVLLKRDEIISIYFSYMRILLTFLSFLPFSFPLTVLASHTRLSRIIESTVGVFQRILVILVLLSLAAFGWGIVKLMLASQNPEERKKSKSIIIWSIVGMFIIASLAGIIKLGQDYFGVGGSTTIPGPILP